MQLQLPPRLAAMESPAHDSARRPNSETFKGTRSMLNHTKAGPRASVRPCPPPLYAHNSVYIQRVHRAPSRRCEIPSRREVKGNRCPPPFNSLTHWEGKGKLIKSRAWASSQ